MQPEALATLLADKFAWGNGDLLIGPHDKLNGLMSLAGVGLSKLSGGSKRARLKQAVMLSPPGVQLNLVKAVLQELPPEDDDPQHQHYKHRQEAREKLTAWVRAQEGVAVPATGSQAVDQILAEFDHLLGKFGAGRAFDRLHSAFSAYLRDLHRALIGDPGQKPLGSLLKAVTDAIPDDVDPNGVAKEVLGAVKRITNTLDRLRNKPAHGEFEQANAELAKDVLSSVFRFLHSRLGDGKV
jgi:hypothetical protein